MYKNKGKCRSPNSIFLSDCVLDEIKEFENKKDNLTIKTLIVRVQNIKEKQYLINKYKKTKKPEDKLFTHPIINIKDFNLTNSGSASLDSSSSSDSSVGSDGSFKSLDYMDLHIKIKTNSRAKLIIKDKDGNFYNMSDMVNKKVKIVAKQEKFDSEELIGYRFVLKEIHLI